MKDIFFIYPNTLFKDIHTYLNDIEEIYIIEEPHFFTKFKFHKQKILLHRASMKYYHAYLNEMTNLKIKYIEYDKVKTFYVKQKNNNIHTFDVIEHEINDKLKKIFKNLTIYDNLSFEETMQNLNDYNEKIKNNNYRHDDFYEWNRSRLNIFMNGDKPLYNKWSFDKDNRNNFKNYEEPKILPSNYNDDNVNAYIDEAKNYVHKNFNDYFGDIEHFIYPITHKQAMQLLKHFLKEKIQTFGLFQDACSKNVIFGSHSLLSSSLNVGLITVATCLSELVKHFNQLSSADKKKLFQNYEGFLRQIIGWRSFTRLLYYFHGREMFEMNFFNHENKLKNSWYNATTGIEPIDFLIQKVQTYAYLHHIERLMYVGNWMLLCKIEPKQVYKWFMITCIDSYDWVMVSNVFGMSQHALNNDVLKMMTRPYICSSNYIKNMSDFNVKDEWATTWNNLYYYFIYENITYLKKNYSISKQVKHWTDKTREDKEGIIKFSKKYLY